MNFDSYKFRASSLGKLMVNGRSKSDPLSETTKSYLKELWICETFDRVKTFESKYTTKGTLVEEDSLTFASLQINEFLMKNEKHYSNDYVMGTPDVVLKDEVIDIKSSWDIFTFGAVDGENKDYYWQLQTYMALTGKTKARLIYCLMSAPEAMVYAETQRRLNYNAYDWKVQIPKSEEQIKEEVRKEMCFDDIEPKKRIKIYEFVFDEEGWKEVEKKMVACREYMNKLVL